MKNSWRSALGVCALLAAAALPVTAPAAEAVEGEAVARPQALAVKPLAGTVDTAKFGAAGLVKAFDLAQALARETCEALPTAGPRIVVHDPLVNQGVLTARLVQDEIAAVTADLLRASAWLAGTGQAGSPPHGLLALPAVTGGIQALAELASLFKTNVAATAAGYGEASARSFFITALAENCPQRFSGLGSGYLGELDGQSQAQLRTQLAGLASAKAGLEAAIGAARHKAPDVRRQDEAQANPDVASASAVLKQAEAFLAALKPADFSDKGPLHVVARHLAYEKRTVGAHVLEFDLRLEGLTIVRDSIFTGQQLRLSGVAFLWYRLHDAQGNLVLARTARRFARPIEVDLRGAGASGDFFAGER